MITNTEERESCSIQNVVLITTSQSRLSFMITLWYWCHGKTSFLDHIINDQILNQCFELFIIYHWSIRSWQISRIIKLSCANEQRTWKSANRPQKFILTQFKSAIFESNWKNTNILCVSACFKSPSKKYVCIWKNIHAT